MPPKRSSRGAKKKPAKSQASSSVPTKKQKTNPGRAKVTDNVNFQNTEPLYEVQIGTDGPETTPVTDRRQQGPTGIPQGDATQAGPSAEKHAPGQIPQSQPGPNHEAQNQAPVGAAFGMFQSSSMPDLGNSQGSVGLGIVQGGQDPTYTASLFDPVSAHIPVKIKEKIWSGQFIDLSILLKSAQELAYDPQLGGDLVIKGGQLTVVQPKMKSVTNIHVWTSAFMVYMSVVLEKWPTKGQEMLKYMYMVRLASSIGHGTGWVRFDEQYRLRKARLPQSSWGAVDMELWVIYVSTQTTSPNQGYQTPAQGNQGPRSLIPHTDGKYRPWDANKSQNNTPVAAAYNNQGTNNQRSFRTCWRFNKASCPFGRQCKFVHKCSKCYQDHPLKSCMSK